jgi:1-aminocyclopropane-1-carboxylate deaminase
LNTSKAIIEKVRLSIEDGEPFSFDIKRDDLIDPVISGNKWRKLEYNLLKAEELHKVGVLTFGGPFSNHLIATAKAASNRNLLSIGVVRGEELNVHSNSTLEACASFGMELIFISRSEYQNKEDPYYLKELASKHAEYFIVPEGGRNYYGVIGCQQILKETKNDYNHVYLAGGTGTTAAGVLLSVPEDTIVHCISVLKGDFLYNDIKQLVFEVLNDAQLVQDYMQRLNMVNDGHFGGYAKVPQVLLNFINSIYENAQVKLDPIYTGKAFYKMVKDFESGTVKVGDKALFIHTGGLQGAKTWKDKLDFL